MNKTQLLKKIAILESSNDQLETEVQSIDSLMKMLGFSNGLTTIKATAEEIIDKGYSEPE